MTEWTNTEEGAGGLTEVVPLLVEDMLRENDGSYSIGAEWRLVCRRDLDHWKEFGCVGADVAGVVAVGIRIGTDGLHTGADNTSSNNEPFNRSIPFNT